MISQSQLEAVLSQLHVSDGFGIQLTETVKTRQLWLVYRYTGQQIPLTNGMQAILISEADKPAYAIDRDSLLVSAICRFINTGGMPSEIDCILSSMAHGIRHHTRAMLNSRTEFFDPLLPAMQLRASELAVSEATEEVIGIHTFEVNDAPLVMEWAEGSHFGVYTLTEYNNLIEKGEREATWIEFTSPDEERGSLPEVRPGEHRSDADHDDNGTGR